MNLREKNEHRRGGKGAEKAIPFPLCVFPASAVLNPQPEDAP
jgi:hypothetical protein